MAVRLFKVAGLMGGGILALGAGALGTHFAYPSLEKNFFHERIDNENKLRQNLDDTNEQVQRLGIELMSQSERNVAQQTQISDLTKQETDLRQDLSKKEDELKKKDDAIDEKKKQIANKEKENNQQKKEIERLGEEYQKKENQFNETKSQKETFEASLTKIKTKLDLTREDILQNTTSNLDPLKIETRKVERKGIEGEWITFSADDGNGGTAEFKIKKPNSPFVNHEQVVKGLQKSGIFFKLPESFKNWDKTIEINLYVTDYFFKATKEEERIGFAMANKTNKFSFKITEYFREDYVEDAFRVLMAMSYLDNIPLKRELNSSDKRLEFIEKPNINFDFSETNTTFSLKQFSETTEECKKVPFWYGAFKTKESFINYWINQTVDLIRTGKIDFSNILNPIFLEKNYKESQ